MAKKEFDEVELAKQEELRVAEEKAREEEYQRYLAEEASIKQKALDRNAKFKNKEELARAIPYMRARDEEKVTGVFKNMEIKGGGHRFGLYMYPGQEFDHWEMFDGMEYTVPYYVAWHLNNMCYNTEYTPLVDEFGREAKGRDGIAVQRGVSDGRYRTAPMQALKKVYRFMFIVPGAPKDLYPSPIIEVTNGIAR